MDQMLDVLAQGERSVEALTQAIALKLTTASAPACAAARPVIVAPPLRALSPPHSSLSAHGLLASAYPNYPRTNGW
jgi:hypothetical protein